MFNPRTTTLRAVSPQNPEPAAIAEAAEVLRHGGLVAFPTETVYGLGANALDPRAVEGIFAAKGRPASNPVIVHVANAAAARKLTNTWTATAERLAAKFWPGPLTLVLTKVAAIPNIVSAGGSTVGLRVPAHPVALALLEAAKIPLAAPSANRSMQISPTTAQHVLAGMDGRIDLILDAGATSGGLESTVLDLSISKPRLLRPGLVTVAQIEEVVGSVVVEAANLGDSPLKSPGLLEKHYAPRARLVCCTGSASDLVEKLLGEVTNVGWLRLNSREALPSNIDHSRVHVVEMPSGAAGYSQRLYAALHECDDIRVDCIVVDLPPQGNEWLAVHDRLRRASASAAPQEPRGN